VTTTTTADVDGYAARVRAALADLPAPDRDDLLADLADHLAEVAADGRLAELGDPEAYAAELRSSAGLPEPRAARRIPGPLRALAARPWARGTLAFLPRLLPGWWVLRGALFPAALIHWQTSYPKMALLAVLTIPISVLVGLNARADSRVRLLDAAGTMAALAAAWLTIVAWNDIRSDSLLPPAETSELSPFDGVTNLYPYSRDGKPLTGVQLFDQYGNPVSLQGDYDREGHSVVRIPAITEDGERVGNVYPQRQRIQDDPMFSPDGISRPPTAPGVRAPVISGA
jgi:hypothetical protein